MKHTLPKLCLTACVFFFILLLVRVAVVCDQRSTVREATPAKIRAFFKVKNVSVLTFLEYSGSEYENKAAKKGQAAPPDFRGAAGAMFSRGLP